MSPLENTTFLIILTVGVVAPLLVDLSPRLRLPVVVLEICLGIVVGPYVLQWTQVGPVIEVLSRFGLAFLFFLGGFELDFQKIRGKPIQLAVLGWLLSLGLALAAGFILHHNGVILSDLVVAIALASTGLGILLPILRDEGELATPFGAYVVAAGTMGEFGPIVMISLSLEKTHGSLATGLLLVGFTLLAMGAALLAARLRPPYLIQALRKRMHTSSQLPLRGSLLLLALLVLLTREFGLDAILGAFAAGVVVSLASKGENQEVLRRKLEGVGYGFFIPIFFIASGMKFDLNALAQSDSALWRVPMFLLLFLLVRGLPALIYQKVMPRRDRAALAFFSSTSLPLVMAVTEIALNTGRMLPENAAALMGGAVLSVIFYPLIGLGLRKSERRDIISPSQVPRA